MAVDEARIIGTASVLIERKLIHGGSNVAHIEDVAVLADYRCRGIGMALVRHVIAYASSCGCYKAVLHCNESLGEFYHGAGFRKQGLSMRVDYPKSL